MDLARSKLMLRIDSTGNKFDIYFKNLRIIAHSAEAPCITLGTGQGSFNIKAAKARIKENITRQVPLPKYEIIEQTGTLITIHFSDPSAGQQHLLELTFQVLDGRLAASFKCLDSSINRCWMMLPATPAESIYGCGEQHSELNLRGKRVPLWVEELGVGRRGFIAWLLNRIGNFGGQWYSTYFPQPTFVSTAHYFCHAETTCYAEFDFTRSHFHELYFWGIPDQLIFDTAENLPAVLESLTIFLGRQPPLPEWARDGVWVAIQGGTEIVEEKVKKALDAGVKLGAVWSQEWCGARKEGVHTRVMWNWSYDETLYRGLPDLIKRLREQGIRYLGYINSFFIPGQPMAVEAEQKGYLVKTKAGETYLLQGGVKMPLVDLSNPAAYAWLKDVIKKNMLGIGLAGWMADFGEYVPTDGVLQSGESAETYHNKYPVIWAKVNYEAVKEAGKLGEVIFFTRSGYTGVSRYTTLAWVGDQLVSWHKDNGLPSAILACISAGFSGIGLVHSDTGGYSMFPRFMKRSKEVFMRWAEHTAFTVVMRTHEGNCPPISWQFDSDEETLRHFARMSRIFVHLKPYTVATLRDYQEHGLPPMRHPIIHYETDKVLVNLKTEYLFGRDLLVVPVLKPKKVTWKVYLPEDKWVHLWSGQEYQGGWYTVPAPLGQPPVFYRVQSPFISLFSELKNLS